MKRISYRLLLFHLLLLVFPVGSMLYLDTYERQLLESQERSMVQEGRILSAALSGKNARERTLEIFRSLAGRYQSRLRVVDKSGRLLADSAVHHAREYTRSVEYPKEDSSREAFLYQLLVPPVRRFVSLFRSQEQTLGSAEYYSGADPLRGKEITAALDGQYGAASRLSGGGQRSLTLYSAIPIFSDSGEVSGAVLVSRSTLRILENLYRIRLDIIRIFLLSCLAALLLSLVAAFTVTRPMRRLRDRAETLLLSGDDLRKALETKFPGLGRRDEIGDLSRSLNELWNRTADRLRLIDEFSSDILHELKNPLSAIRSSAELSLNELEELEAAAPLLPFQRTILEEGGRIQRMLEEMRDFSSLDAGLMWECVESIDLRDFLPEFLRSYQAAAGPSITYQLTIQIEQPFLIEMNRDRLRQVLGNLLDNAADFARSTVFLILNVDGEILVEDDGPGIDEKDLDHIFRRFYSGRRDKRDHSGLGLAIAMAIVSAGGGSLTAENRQSGGARFRLRLSVHPS